MNIRKTKWKVLLFILQILPFLNLEGQNCTVNAGSPMVYCNVTRFDLEGRQGGDFAASPATWSQVGGSPLLTINNPNALRTTVSGAVPGVFIFRLSLLCQDGVTNFNDVTITVLPTPTLALAGPDQTVCNAGVVALSANSPGSGETGTWKILSGGGSLSNSNSPTATFNTPSQGDYSLEWSIGSGGCSTRDTMNVRVIEGVQPVNAGSDIVLSCGGNTTSLNGSSPGLSPQAGLWTFVSGPNIPIIQTPDNTSTSVNGLVPGVYVFQWSVSGPCFSGSD